MGFNTKICLNLCFKYYTKSYRDKVIRRGSLPAYLMRNILILSFFNLCQALNVLKSFISEDILVRIQIIKGGKKWSEDVKIYLYVYQNYFCVFTFVFMVSFLYVSVCYFISNKPVCMIALSEDVERFQKHKTILRRMRRSKMVQIFDILEEN